MTRGGKREGAGKPKGVKYTERTEQFTKRITPEEKEFLEKQLEVFRHGNTVDIFVVSEPVDIYGVIPIGVFSSKEKAEQFIQKFDSGKTEDCFDRCEIKEFELDKENFEKD